ncbi:MAG: cell division protein FtsZ [bacterium]|nr:cell division protein FtsZ [bacterium]
MGNVRFNLESDRDFGTKIKVVGIGGAGNNALRRMIESNIEGVEFIGINTDVMELKKLNGYRIIPIGTTVTGGKGTGGNPELGKKAAEESKEEIKSALEGADLIIVALGGGGGTGTGAAPVCVELAKETNALTIAIVTRPFLMEGSPRQLRAEEGIRELREKSDTLVVIPNQKLLEANNGDIRVKDAFLKVDSILMQATRGICDLLTTTGEINLDFRDLEAVMKKGGDSLLGFGSANGEERAIKAAEQAVSSPFLDDMNISGARNILINISASTDVKMKEINDAVNYIKDKTGKDDTEVFAGITYNDALGDELQITLIVTGLNQTKNKPKQEAITLETNQPKCIQSNPIEMKGDPIDRILRIPNPAAYFVNDNSGNGAQEVKRIR